MAEKVIGYYRLVVGEMSWKQQLECSRQYNHWLWGKGRDQLPFDRQVSIATLLALHAPIRLYRDNQLLPDGTYNLSDEVCITLPLTEDGLNALPVSIAQFIVNAALEENPQTITNFTEGTGRILTQLSALPSASGLSDKPTPV
jgi:hypothetical protein